MTKIQKATNELTRKDLEEFIKDSVDRLGKSIEKVGDNDIVAYYMGIPFTKKELIKFWYEHDSDPPAYLLSCLATFKERAK